MYFLYFFLTSAGLLLRPGRVSNWVPWLIVDFVCLIVVGFLVRNRLRSLRWRFVHHWYPVIMFIVCFEETSYLSFLLRDRWQDQYLLQLEGWLFSVPPTVWLGRLSSPLVTELMEVGYFSYFLLFLIVGGVLYSRQDKHPFRQVMDTTVLSYLICYLVFILFPTEGPAYTLAAQPNVQLPGAGPFHWMVLWIQKTAGVHGNAFPSAHVAGGVVALIFAWRYAPKLGLSLTPLVILLCSGAVYDRYHYLSDVVVGAVIGAVPATFWTVRIDDC